MAFNDKSFTRNLYIRLEFLNIRRQKNHIEQLLKIISAFRGNRDHRHIPAPFFRLKSMLRKVRHRSWNIRPFPINFIDRYDNLCVRPLRKFNCFHGLRLNSIIRRNNNHDNIRKHRSVLTNRRKGFMPRRIKKSNFSPLVFKLVR